MDRKKRVSLTLEQKLKIVQKVEKSEVSKARIARQFNIHRTTIAKILKQKDDILKAATWRSAKGRKTSRYVASGISSISHVLYIFINK